MGQNQPNNLKKELQIDNDEWQPIKFEPNRTIVESRKTNIQAESHLVQIYPQYNVQRELEIYYFRKIQENALVAVYAASHLKNSNELLCGNIEKIKVILERTPRRLSELPHLSFPQSLYILSEALRGFQDCYQKVGLFQITDQMIAFNTNGEVRVWLNQNFAENHPTTQRPYLQITSANQYKQSAFQQQRIFLENILQVVQSKTQNQRFPQQFRRIIYNQDKFVDAYCEIENYCNQQKIWIPDRLPSNSLLLENKKERYKIADFQRDPQDCSNITCRSEEPHATYLPNVQYSYPRVTYVEAANTNANSNSEHIRPRTIRISFSTNTDNKSPKYNTGFLPQKSRERIEESQQFQNNQPFFRSKPIENITPTHKIVNLQYPPRSINNHKAVKTTIPYSPKQ